MIKTDSINIRNCIIASLVVFFSICALWLRLIPMINMGNTNILNMVAMDDPLFNLRQIELILANFPNYGWFEAMTHYPFGTEIYWGPLFPTIIAVCCLITGAATRPEIIGIALLVPPVMAAITIILMYFVGRVFGDWKTGLLASGFAAIVSGQFFTVSWYGYIDHHIAEVLFSTLFCLMYSYAIVSEKPVKIELYDFGSYKKILFLSVLAGLSYLLGLFVMPTMILFALIVGIFTLVQFVIDAWRGRTSEYLLVINITVFLVAIAGLLLFGIKTTGIGLSVYSVGHIYAYCLLIGGTILLYGLSIILKNRERLWYPLVLLASAVIFSGALFFFAPHIYDLFISSLFAFFGQQPVTETVQEARGWSSENAWVSFNYGLILFFGGALVMLYNNWKEEHPWEVFALVWSVVMFFSTWQHMRYEYYLAVNIALMSAVCTAFIIGRAWPEIQPRIGGSRDSVDLPETKDHPKGKSQKSKNWKNTRQKTRMIPVSAYAIIIVAILTVGTGILFAYTSTSYSYTNAVSNTFNMNPDWRESLEWLGNNTPETGVDYLTIYDHGTFTYPPQSYGVMSWWDYGHMITYIAKRIPNANPFQQGVAGDTGAAAYFISSSEDQANTILDQLRTRYVITDIQMDTGKFPAMATWYNSSLAADPYMVDMFVPDQNDPGRAESRLFDTPQYYFTMISRLHNFDGSMKPATEVLYLEFVDTSITNESLPVVTNGQVMNATAAQAWAEEYNLKAPKGYHATVVSTSLIDPAADVPALRHYRLVHESPTNVFTTGTPDVKYVKVFEYVKGAHIKGDGIIELDLISNTGRNFTYRQESINGEFIVPFSTTGNPYEVKATGKYRIRNSGQEYDVPETAVLSGNSIN